VAVCFVALFSSLHFYHLEEYHWELYAVLFSGALIGYNLIKYADLILLKRHFLFKKSIIGVTLMVTIIVLLILLKENLISILVLAIAGSIGLLYMLPIYKGNGLRSIPLLKIGSVAISWAILLVIYPLFSEFHAGVKMNQVSIFYLVLEILQVLTLVSALCVPFEIRDLKYDAPELRTLPQLIGVVNTKRFGIAMTLLFLIFQLLELERPNITLMITPIILSVVLATLILKSTTKKHDYYASIMVEAVPVLWLGLLWTLS
jgi:hypothetical protein